MEVFVFFLLIYRSSSYIPNSPWLVLDTTGILLACHFSINSVCYVPFVNKNLNFDVIQLINILFLELREINHSLSLRYKI